MSVDGSRYSVLTHNDKFAVSISHLNYLTVHISTGALSTLKRLHLTGKVNFSVDDALAWAIQHELHHLELGHFELPDGVPVLNLVSRASEPVRPFASIPQADWPDVSPCLELQADHEAIEMVLGGFDASDWSGLRELASSISAVMVLIEKADEDLEGEHSTHPKAATRIFQLLGHISEMWAIKHQLSGRELPSDDLIRSFSSDVILPAYFDAISLANAAEVTNIAKDLGEPDIFFSDIARAKLGDWDALQTVGAKEWARLKPLNEKLLPILPYYADAT
ncbi:hypothetical protein KMP13_08990 [Epibacterium ulvae]|uniref:hypothetical protein n=1 Tax=Epibacterium ulvae TaxID=1156985 RepID=UPI001BFC3266|nr:hypothetical protein [Epibacterium ulvae]MBT8154032.1 hypothetical protein [Epibacterium ulvae]